ncbi:hypothetical protein [Brevundimonas sp.]|uniref:hypothetical protein n=1 Tax=Brevundimonas sp. TaxID=1871086 RepID=UPI002D2A2C0F|nr:hypothetical protein [Brevundimonas sp.]HYC99100.1 hypothetical protein [Brevundimonas sp.]
MAKMVQVAGFAERHEAELAAYFLQRHSLNAFAGASYHGEVEATSTHSGHMECPVWVSASDYPEAVELLKKVTNGGFADADPNKDSREGLGAALALAIAPEPGYRRPHPLVLWAPILCVPALAVLGFLVKLLWTALASQ